MSDTKSRIALAGLGAAAKNIHIPAYAKLPDVEFVGAFDPAIPAGPASASGFSATTFNHYPFVSLRTD